MKGSERQACSDIPWAQELLRHACIHRSAAMKYNQLHTCQMTPSLQVLPQSRTSAWPAAVSCRPLSACGEWRSDQARGPVQAPRSGGRPASCLGGTATLRWLPTRTCRQWYKSSIQTQCHHLGSGPVVKLRCEGARMIPTMYAGQYLRSRACLETSRRLSMGAMYIRAAVQKKHP